MKKTPIILAVIGFAVLLFFGLLIKELYAYKPKFSWYPSYSKKGNQPYDCKLVFQELDNLYPKRNIKSLDGSSKLLKEYDDFFIWFDYDDYAKNDDNEDVLWGETVAQEVTEGTDEVSTNSLTIESKFEKLISKQLDKGEELPNIDKSNIIIIGEPNTTSAVLKRMLAHTYNGNTFFIASENFRFFQQLIKIPTENSYVDTTFITFKDNSTYYYKKDDIQSYFTSNFLEKDIFAKNKQGKPILVQIPYGDGRLILSTTPKAFTNYYLLKNNNADFIEKAVGLTPNLHTFWTDKYIRSNGESNTPSKLDYIKKQPPLWWAFCLALATLISYMLLATKRKQRLIPDFHTPKNSTIEFVQIMAQLHLQTGGHHLIAKKKINYFLEHIRHNYHLDTSNLDNEFVEKLISVSQKDPNHTRFTISVIQSLLIKENISTSEIIGLHKAIEKFKTQ